MPAVRALLIFSAGALIVAAYAAGLGRGLDTYIAPYAAGPFLHATCVVATKWLTGVGNYVCLSDVQDIMQPIRGIMYDLGLREDGSSWAYLFDRQFVDHALHQLFAHAHWTVPATTSGPPYNGIQGIGWGMDEGHADFVNLAYHVFGPSIEALYQTYWLVFGVSAVAFVWAYRGALAPLILVVVVAVIEYMIFSTSILWFTDGTNPTTEPGNPRFLSCLCVVPLLHFITAARADRPLRWRDVLPLAVQSLVLGLAMLQRLTVLWAVLAAIFLAVLYWLWRRRPAAAARPRKNYYTIAALIVAVAAVTQFYLHGSAHPGIAAKGFTSGHNVWFGMFYELQTNPEWKTRYAAVYGNTEGDFLPNYAWRLYLEHHPEEWPRWNPGHNDPFQIGVTQAGVEELCRKAFFEFARHDPKFVAEVWFIYNPLKLAQYTGNFLAPFLSWLVLWPLIALLGFGALCGVVAPGIIVREVGGYVPLVGLLCFVAALPNLASLVIPESLSDYFSLLSVLIGITVAAVGVGLGAATKSFSLGRPVAKSMLE